MASSMVVATRLSNSTPLQNAGAGNSAAALSRGPVGGVVVNPAMAMVSLSSRNYRDGLSCSASLHPQQQQRHDSVVAAGEGEEEEVHSNWSARAFGRREGVLSGMSALAGWMLVGRALADFDEDYKSETQAVIDRIRGTLALEKSDPSKADAVAVLRLASNDWVAKYRREKSVSGRKSYSDMYSVLNALSGHYISFGPMYPIPVKRRDRILEEVTDAEKALKRGR